MGLKNFLKGKLDKHGGAAGLAKAVASKPQRVLSGGRGFASGEKDASVSPEAMREAFKNVPTEPDADGYIAVAPSTWIDGERSGTYDVHDAQIAVYRYQGALYAIDSACTHEDGPLGESEVGEGGVITCPYHDWRFELSTGECLTHPNRQVGCWSIRDKDGFVWIGPRKSEGATERGGEHDDGLVIDKPLDD